MVFGQLIHRESLSDTMLCLSATTDKLHHLGIGEVVSLSTLSKANEKHDWLDLMPFQRDSFYVLDHGYTNFERLYRMHASGAFLVIRAKDNFHFNRAIA